MSDSESPAEPTASPQEDKRTRRLTEEQVKEIAVMWPQCGQYAVIAKKLGCSANTVKWLVHHGHKGYGMRPLVGEGRLPKRSREKAMKAWRQERKQHLDEGAEQALRQIGRAAAKAESQVQEAAREVGLDIAAKCGEIQQAITGVAELVAKSSGHSAQLVRAAVEIATRGVNAILNEPEFNKKLREMHPTTAVKLIRDVVGIIGALVAALNDLRNLTQQLKGEPGELIGIGGVDFDWATPEGLMAYAETGKGIDEDRLVDLVATRMLGVKPGAN